MSSSDSQTSPTSMVGNLVLAPFRCGQYLAGGTMSNHSSMSYVYSAINIGITGYLIQRYGGLGIVNSLPLPEAIGMAKPYVGSAVVQMGAGAIDAMIMKKDN